MNSMKNLQMSIGFNTKNPLYESHQSVNLKTIPNLYCFVKYKLDITAVEFSMFKSTLITLSMDGFVFLKI